MRLFAQSGISEVMPSFLETHAIAVSFAKRSPMRTTISNSVKLNPSIFYVLIGNYDLLMYNGIMIIFALIGGLLLGLLLGFLYLSWKVWKADQDRLISWKMANRK